MADLKLLKELTELRGMSGYEKDVRVYIENELKELNVEIQKDKIGSIAGISKGNGPKILVAGHMDEIGLMITSITEDGYLKFHTVGGWWSQVLLAQQFDVTTKDGKVYRAVMGSKAPHLLTDAERSTPTSIDSMYLDLGMSSKQAVLDLGIRVGDMVTPAIEFQELNGGDLILAKAFDNRAGCGVVLELLKNFEGVEHNNEIIGAATVQEEVGLRGARTVGQKFNPDVVFALDVTIATDTPGLSKSCKAGNGPAILLMDSSMIGHRGLRDFVISVAEELGIPYQLDYLKRGGTDAGQIHLSHDGAPGMAVCIPARYIHSHTSVISKSDYFNTIKLLTEVIKRLDEEQYQKILEA